MENIHSVLIVFSFVFGAIFGSFLNVVILRLPKEKSLGGRSCCPRCGHSLGALDLLPLVSFVFLRGRCRYCRQSISSRYLVIELITGLLFAFSCFLLQPESLIGALELLKYWAVCATLITVFVIDLEHFLILDRVVFPGLVFLLLLNLFLDFFLHSFTHFTGGNFVSGLLAALALAAPFFGLWYFSQGAWLGFGDVKLALFLGVSLGLGKTLVGFMLAAMIGGIFSLFLLTLSNKTMKSRLPFGTFLSVGALIALFYGDVLLVWYLRLLGF